MSNGPTTLAGLSALFVCLPLFAQANDVEEIVNFHEYSARFASAGQPTADQLEQLKEAGFERIIYAAYSDQPNSLANEDRLVKELGMEYVHVPVEWSAPTVADFELIAAALTQDPSRKTLLHCQVNYRASAFSFLYRVLYEDVPVADAKADLNAVWVPNSTWRDLIFAVLAKHAISPHCDGCDWTPVDEPPQ